MNSDTSCEYNMDTGCVELRMADGTVITIDCTSVENEFVDNMYQWSELDYQLFNDPAVYADLVLGIVPAAYLKAVTEYKLFEN